MVYDNGKECRYQYYYITLKIRVALLTKETKYSLAGVIGGNNISKIDVYYSRITLKDPEMHYWIQYSMLDKVQPTMKTVRMCITSHQGDTYSN